MGWSKSSRVVNTGELLFAQVVHSKLRHPLKPTLVSVRHVNRAFTHSDVSSVSGSEGLDDAPEEIPDPGPVISVVPSAESSDPAMAGVGDDDGDGLSGQELFRCGNQV